MLYTPSSFAKSRNHKSNNFLHNLYIPYLSILTRIKLQQLWKILAKYIQKYQPETISLTYSLVT